MSTRYLKWLPVVDEDLCTGCGRCIEACGPKCLEMTGSVAQLLAPEACGSEEHCIGPCPESALRMAWLETDGDKCHGKWRAEVDIFETHAVQIRD